MSLPVLDAREHPDGLEQLVAVDDVDGDRVLCRTVAFRIGRDRDWLPATAGSQHVHTLTTWESFTPCQIAH